MKNNRSSGVLLHPSSLPSDFGIGDFGKSAYSFVDFLKKAGQKYWQMLPLGPTTYGDSPYQSLSAFAGNPLFISPEKLIEQGLLDCAEIRLDEFNLSEDSVNYAEVISLKNGLLRLSYKNFTSSSDKKLAKEFNAFCKINSYWLNDFAFFSSYKSKLIDKRKNENFSESEGFAAFASDYGRLMSEDLLKDCYYGAEWHSWDKGQKARGKQALAKETEKLKDEINYARFVQFIFMKQWLELKQYANENGIEIIGDLPIFVALDSSDVWAEPKLFDLDDKLYPSSVAGVPPDYFSETGQLWGNPLFDWKEHEKTGYLWWKNRFRHTRSMYDMVRVDHFRGFDSYWTIPAGESTAANGKWRKGPGKKFFIEIEKALGSLPIIAEDLGIITPRVRKLREGLNFPGMRILQYAFNDDAQNINKPHNFSDSNIFVYTGTHDNNTTKGWYDAADAKTKDMFRRYMNVSGSDAHWDLIRLAMLSNAVVSIIPAQDILGLGEKARLNTPGTACGNWQFRLLPNDLTDEHSEKLSYLSELSDRIRGMVEIKK